MDNSIFKMKINEENITKYLFGVILAVCGWIVQSNYSKHIECVDNQTKELIGIKMQITEINTKIMTEDKVKEIVEQEFLRRGFK